MKQNISIAGAVDLHSHCGPSLIGRRVNGFEAAYEAAVHNMDAIVLKEHYFPTIYAVEHIETLLEDAGESIDVIGSAVMNYCNGGFNPFFVQTAIDFGAEVIWAPTIDSQNDGEKSGGLGKKLDIDNSQNPEYQRVTGLYALDGEGELTEDVRICLDKIVDHNVLLAIGHLSYPETEAMVEYVSTSGHEKIMIDHPTYPVTGFDRDQQETLVNLGAYLNFPFCSISPRSGWTDRSKLYESIRAIGVDHCVVSSDMGQIGNPSAPDGLQMLGEILVLEGLSKAEFRQLVEITPKQLLDRT